MTRRLRARRRLTAALLPLALVLGAGCSAPQRQPEVADEGLQATGRLDGKRVAVSAGNPTVTYGDCDPNEGRDVDLCLAARTIDGETLNLVIENPAVLAPGRELAVRDAACADRGCDAVADEAVVDVRLGGSSVRVVGGHLDVRAADERFAAEFDLTLPGGGQLTGTFDVRPGAA